MDMREFQEVYNFIRFGTRGDWVSNDRNDRRIERLTKGVDTMAPSCACYEREKYTGTLCGTEAIKWLLS